MTLDVVTDGVVSDGGTTAGVGDSRSRDHEARPLSWWALRSQEDT
jgi:hypothetical protein